jgi:hypothetical protein
MIPPYLEQLEEQVRRAAASRQYEEIVRLSAAFAGSVRAYTQALPKGDPRAGDAMRRLVDLLSWSLVMVQGARAACSAELRRVSTANRYSRRDGAPGRTMGVNLDA